ncbi:MAG: DUF924 family protein [Cyanobacteria bacterium P01_F01_bin.53]
MTSQIFPRARAILDFWFTEANAPNYGHYRKAWFIKDDAFDQQIRRQFLSDYEKAAAGENEAWKTQPESAVALLLLLDQFPRNLFRGDPRSFATDPQALSVAQHLVTTGTDKGLIAAHRFFIYVPFEHSENMEHQNQCVALMEELIQDVPDLEEGLKGGLDYAIRHREVVERFGRFPHRNEILGRASTAEEVEFLKQPGSRF